MSKIAVVNNFHDIGVHVLAWMLKECGFTVLAAGESFSKALLHQDSGNGWKWPYKSAFSGIADWNGVPKDALLVDTYPQSEPKLRSAGWTGPFLLYWCYPVTWDWIQPNFNPGSRVGVVSMNWATYREIKFTKSCPVEFVYPPYHEVVKFRRRKAYQPFLITVVKNACGWTNVPVLEKLRDHPNARLELYGGVTPEWSKVLPHEDLMKRMSEAMALFHSKPTDNGGNVITEAIMQGVPILFRPYFMKSTGLDFLFRHEENCFVVEETEEVLAAADKLRDPKVNQRISDALLRDYLNFSNWTTNKMRLLRLLRNLGI